WQDRRHRLRCAARGARGDQERHDGRDRRAVRLAHGQHRRRVCGEAAERRTDSHVHAGGDRTGEVMITADFLTTDYADYTDTETGIGCANFRVLIVLSVKSMVPL